MQRSTGVVNTYYPGVGTPAAGATSVQVDTPHRRPGTPIAAGDMLLVMQMQDAQIDTHNTGDYGAGVAATGHGLHGAQQLGPVRIRGGRGRGERGRVAIVGAGGTGGLLNAYATVATDDSATGGPADLSGHPRAPLLDGDAQLRPDRGRLGRPHRRRPRHRRGGAR